MCQGERSCGVQHAQRHVQRRHLTLTVHTMAFVLPWSVLPLRIYVQTHHMDQFAACI